MHKFGRFSIYNKEIASTYSVIKLPYHITYRLTLAKGQIQLFLMDISFT